MGTGLSVSPSDVELATPIEARVSRSSSTVSDFTATTEQAQGLAWRLLIAATAVFIASVIGIGYATQWYIGSASISRPSSGQLVEGVGFLRRPGRAEWVMLPSTYRLEEGDTVRTSAGSRTFLRLFDYSTILLYPGTTMQVVQMRRGRYRVVRRTVILRLLQGRVHIGVAPDEDPGRDWQGVFEVHSPAARVVLEDGSYSIEVTPREANVLVRVGRAVAHAADASLPVSRGQRVQVPTGATPIGPLPIERDILRNGAFAGAQRGQLVGWTVLDISEREPPGRVIPGQEDGQGMVSFERAGRGHGETIIRQSLERDLSDTEAVVLSANVRVDSHSLSGGGWAGTEYPLMLRLVYRDTTGREAIWYHGFFLHNRENLPVRDADEVAPGEWYPYEVNLLEFVPRPAHIVRLEVLAAGWDYRSAVRDVGLLIR